MSSVLAYVAAGIVTLWGVAHVLPTGRVVRGYSDTSPDNRLVITQEWIAEAMAMWFIASVVLLATALGGSDPHQTLTDWIYRASATMLLALAAHRRHWRSDLGRLLQDLSFLIGCNGDPASGSELGLNSAFPRCRLPERPLGSKDCPHGAVQSRPGPAYWGRPIWYTSHDGRI